LTFSAIFPTARAANVHSRTTLRDDGGARLRGALAVVVTGLDAGCLRHPGAAVGSTFGCPPPSPAIDPDAVAAQFTGHNPTAWGLLD
jgi:hypothetical protein